MDWKLLLPGVCGAIVGATGWLCVGLFLSRRQAQRQAKNAGRAVYFELLMNRVNVQVALEYDTFVPLGRSSFDRLLPELATWLAPDELHTIVNAYMSQAGYEQAGSGEHRPPADLRRQALAGILATHDHALDLLRARVFSEDEARRISGAGAISLGADEELTRAPGRDR
jgi:hypothetical protein